MSNMGPITVGTIITLRFLIYIITATLFQLNLYIDKDAVITTFSTTTGANYLYYNLIEGSGIIATQNFF